MREDIIEISSNNKDSNEIFEENICKTDCDQRLENSEKTIEIVKFSGEKWASVGIVVSVDSPQVVDIRNLVSEVVTTVNESAVEVIENVSKWHCATVREEERYKKSGLEKVLIREAS